MIKEAAKCKKSTDSKSFRSKTSKTRRYIVFPFERETSVSHSCHHQLQSLVFPPIIVKDEVWVACYFGRKKKKSKKAPSVVLNNGHLKKRV